MSLHEQLWYEASITTLWISYVLAIVVKPGSPPRNFSPKAGEWRRWCKKCQNYKPERCHHCKTCGVCVLKMDHHCPWTNNCVGHRNFPHFIRFLVLVICNTAFVMIKLCERVGQYYEDRNLPSYLVDKTEMFFVILLLPIDIFVLLTVFILFIRCITNFIFKGMTQIEIWEMERIESQIYTERLWLQIRKNYESLHGKPMPQLSLWNRTARFYETEASEPDSDAASVSDPIENSAAAESHSIVPQDFTVDDIVFPYDLGIWQNTIACCGYPWSWFLPWRGPPSSGIHYKKNEYMDDDELSLPWPPDGGHQEALLTPREDPDISAADLRNLADLRRRLDPRQHMSRAEWTNDLGETLDDFGVDLDAEDTEHDHLIAK